MSKFELTAREAEILSADDWSQFPDEEIAAIARKEHERERRYTQREFVGSCRKTLASQTLSFLKILQEDCADEKKRTPRRNERLKLDKARSVFSTMVHDFRTQFFILCEIAGWVEDYKPDNC